MDHAVFTFSNWLLALICFVARGSSSFFFLCYSNVIPLNEYAIIFNSFYFWWAFQLFPLFVYYEYYCHELLSFADHIHPFFLILYIRICMNIWEYRYSYIFLPYIDRFHFSPQIFAVSLFPKLFLIESILAREFYFSPNCHKSWPWDLICPMKCDRNNVCHFWPEALRTIAWFGFSLWHEIGIDTGPPFWVLE